MFVIEKYTLNDRFLHFLENNHKGDNISFQIKSPNQEKGLQVVDIASYALYRKYEFNDRSFFELIEDKVLIEEKI